MVNNYLSETARGNEIMFKLQAPFKLMGDQIKAIQTLSNNFNNGIKRQVLRGATGTGKTFTISNIIEKIGKKTLVLAHNKTLWMWICDLDSSLVVQLHAFSNFNKIICINFFNLICDFFSTNARKNVTKLNKYVIIYLKEKELIKMTIKNLLYTYIKNKYKDNKPILLVELYEAFPNLKKGTIRENMRRFVLDENLIKIKNGVYGFPDPNRILKTPTFDTDETINKKYIINESGSVIGYRSGFHIANSLRLTTQTPSITLIYSNEVANRKRTIKIHNNKITINQARTIVTDNNYKLLQVLDLLNEFDKYNELSFDEARQIIINYLKENKLTKKDIEDIVEIYPKNAQINFYKMGVLNEIT